MSAQNSLRDRLVTYKELKPCMNAFIDTRSPGSEAKENFTIIGPGVSENPDQYVHISLPHGFNIGGARQPPNCVNSQHSHETAEVFVVLSGDWQFRIGETGEEFSAKLGPGDTISIPTQVFRGFKNIGKDIGFLWAVLGGDDAGHVMWSPYVFEMAKNYGLVLLKNGTLIDLTKGQKVPEGAQIMPVTSKEDLARMRDLKQQDVDNCVVLLDGKDNLAEGPLSKFSGVKEFALVGPANEAEQIGAGKMAWNHGFHVRRLSFDAGAKIPPHKRHEEEVLFVQQGQLTVLTASGSVIMEAGDTLTIPIEDVRDFTANEQSNIYVVRGSDAPQAPAFI